MGGGASSHLRACWVRFTIDLHPSRSNDAMQGVRDQLQHMLLRYNDDLHGVLLAYSKEKIQSMEAMVHPYFPYFRVYVTALVFVFQPAVGARLTGVVNAVGHDYIGVLVLGIFNAAIGREHIPSHLQSRILERCWASTNGSRQRIKVGDSLSFSVHRVHHEGDFFTLAGSLMAGKDSTALAANTAASGRPASPQPKAPAPAAAAASQSQPQKQKQKKKRPKMSMLEQPEAAAQPSADTSGVSPATPGATASALQAQSSKKAKKLKHSTADKGPAATTDPESPSVQLHSSKKRQPKDSDEAATSAGTTAALANGVSPAALPEPKARAEANGTASLEAAAAAKRLAKQQRKQAAAAAAAATAAAALPGAHSGDGSGGQPSHRKEGKRRHSEAASLPGSNGTTEQPKKKKKH